MVGLDRSASGSSEEETARMCVIICGEGDMRDTEGFMPSAVSPMGRREAGMSVSVIW